MKQNQKGFSVSVVLLIIMLVALIGFTGLYVSQVQETTPEPESDSQNSSSAKGSPVSSTTNNPTVDSMLRAVEYELLDTAPGSACSSDRDVCYIGEIFFLKMRYPVTDSVRTVAANLYEDNWLLDDGKPTSIFLESSTVTESPSNLGEGVADRDLILQEAGAETNYGNWSYFNPGFFGGEETMYRDNEGVYFFAFSEAELQTNEQPYYILESELSVSEMYDFDELLSNLDNDSYILSITLGEELSRSSDKPF